MVIGELFDYYQKTLELKPSKIYETDHNNLLMSFYDLSLFTTMLVDAIVKKDNKLMEQAVEKYTISNENILKNLQTILLG